ncbi:MAG: plasmid pRiA4b ORF-3 family protein [Candidatus Taylorbacteria bacterium]|nr:plasmid pRiA4b ORF-3 family protein [Candidatus Taylorbacteria bacterium]
MTIKDKKVFQFKVSLECSKPLIWRRILIPEDASFFDLHMAIQDSMGWLDYHLHCFYISQKRTTMPIIVRLPNPEFDDDGIGIVLDERLEKIASHFNRSIKQCKYEYDFGDGWSHTVLFENELPLDINVKYPQCLAGKNACPPEDSGGIWGYEDKLKILNNPKHPEYKEVLEWFCIDEPSEFDPAEFDLNEIEFRDTDESLKEYMKRSYPSENKTDCVSYPRSKTDEVLDTQHHGCLFGIGMVHRPIRTQRVSSTSQSNCRGIRTSLSNKSDSSERIALLMQKNLPRMGRWEIAQRADPITEKTFGKDLALILNLVVHEESYFILNTYVSPPAEEGSVVKVLLEAISNNSALPNIVLTKDKKIFAELESIAGSLDFKVLLVNKLKASPQIFRDMTRLLG